MEPLNVHEAVQSIKELRAPKVIGTLNGQPVRIARIIGEFDWHEHSHADEFILILKGSLSVHMADNSIVVGENEVFIVPRGVQHKTVAEEEVHVLFIRPD
jgi:mannose-6-phosphate isomerase-like protein (cupin superfamily)